MSRTDANATNGFGGWEILGPGSNLRARVPHMKSTLRHILLPWAEEQINTKLAVFRVGCTTGLPCVTNNFWSGYPASLFVIPVSRLLSSRTCVQFPRGNFYCALLVVIQGLIPLRHLISWAGNHPMRRTTFRGVTNCLIQKFELFF